MKELKSYQEYKDSGVKWLGDIPKRWNITKLKRVAYLRQINIPVEQLSGSTWYYYDIPTIQKTRKGRIESGVHIKSNKYLLQGDEILISKLNPRKGTVVQVEHNDDYSIICSTELMPMVATDIHPRFLFYCLSNSVTADVLNSMVTSVTNSHQRVNPKDIEDFCLAVPAYKLQICITEYLDHAIHLIEDLIANKKRLINLLEEKRQAIISETVTEGLDPNVKMKDSGIEWIGEIPERWEVVKIKRYLKVKNGREIEKELPIGNSEGIDVFGSGGVFKKTNKSLYEGESVLFGRKGTIGKPLYVNQAFWTVDTMYYTEFSKESYPKWFYYMFLIFPWEEHTTKTAIPSIVGSDIENEFFAIPTYEEQKLIVTYLTAKMDSIDCAIKNIKYQILKLNEYRESLIYEAVTGKIDLRDYEEETDES